MDDREEDDSRYPPNPYSSNRHKVRARNSSYNDEEEEEEEEDDDDDEQVGEEELGEEEEEDEEVNGGELVIGETNQEEEDDNDNGIDDDDEDGIDDGVAFYRNKEVDNDERHRKKRKLKSLAYGYEFAPRIAAAATPPSVTGSKPQSFGIGSGGRNSPADWSEHATFVLLDAWGDRFLQLGRKSLRSEEWVEVAKKVSHGSKQVRTDTQCRNRLDTLKKKYKKEKMMLAETGESSSKWTFFKKMDMLLSSSSSSRQPPGLSCGLDSGEYVFMNPKSYLNRSNGLDEMRDSPGNSESSEGIGDDSDGLPPKRTRSVETEHGGSSFRLLADSIKKFGEIYEKIENSKRQQMVELEKMRMDFHRDLELQKRQIMERAHAEIAKIRQGDDEEIDVSTGNTSG